MKYLGSYLFICYFKVYANRNFTAQIMDLYYIIYISLMKDSSFSRCYLPYQIVLFPKYFNIYFKLTFTHKQKFKANPSDFITYNYLK